jgi:N6-L-threonylcarbamoyladenine synthase
MAAKMNEPLVLGIETSCDETAVGIVRGRTLLSHIISSSVEEHARFGGVVPEIASRAHLEAMIPVISQALDKAGVKLSDVDGVSVTAAPGLIGALLVGTSSAAGLALALNKPLYAVNHLAAHVSVDALINQPEFGAMPSEKISDELKPSIALLVSGGHSSILKINSFTDEVETLGSTIDDAAGEAFDKVARILGLAFPGGPSIDAISQSGNSSAIAFPHGLSDKKDEEKHRYNFSFSGLKTAVNRHYQSLGESERGKAVADIAASFQEAVVDVLLKKSFDAAQNNGFERLIIAGGVAANSRLRLKAIELGKARGIEVRIPPMSLCTDNGAMVASLGALAMAKGVAPTAIGFSAEATHGVKAPIY